MYVVTIHHWQEATTELAQALADALKVTAFDARQRLVGNGPAVVATFAELDPAQRLVKKLQEAGFRGGVIDASAACAGNSFCIVHRFLLENAMLHIEEVDGRKVRIAYSQVGLLLPATRVTGHMERHTITERKFSMGKTLIAGGLPMTRKVERRETVSGEERERVLYLCTKSRPWFIFPQLSMVYDGLGARMKPSREMNFNELVAELRRRSPAAGYDDRLINRATQAKLLGPLLSPETNLDLAVEILARDTAVAFPAP
jgi:hypothetical protein